MVKYRDRLNFAMEAADVDASELARRMGVTYQAVKKVLDGRSNAFSAPNNAKAAQNLKVSSDWLATGRGPMATDNNVEPGPEMRGLVPVISWVQAGQWCDSVDLFQPGDSDEWLACPAKHGPHTFALRVRGVSMEPKYRDGAIIFVDPDRTADHLSNVVVRQDNDNEVTFKQLVIEDGVRFLRPLNPDWPGPKLIKVESDSVICGVVIGQFIED